MEKNDFEIIIKLIEESKNRTLQKINEELIYLYWNVGKYLNEKKQTINYGDKYFADLATHINSIYPTLKGFTRRGLYRMMQFYNAYTPYFEKVSALLTQLSWTNHLLLLSSTKDFEERLFYMKLSIQEHFLV